ncbi:MAG: glycosyltransferase family 39 protein [Pseudomonadota bacterium]|nr:glycosyltransferase family 39 protein [Pseudomonadota bacterium]
MQFGPLKTRRTLLGLGSVLLLAWCVGMFARGYWTPDEPREADIAWRMSWQTDKAVPLLAGEAFCEKPPLTYWLAAFPIRFLGAQAWVARLPNLLYALITALSIGLLASRCAGRLAGLVGAAAISTFLLSYQVAIWLATDAPLLATVSVALLGAYIGFYATSTPERLRGYLLMHTALGLGFLCKSAVAWMVPTMAILTLSIWERRWRELLRWELYVGVLIQAAMILTWVWFVYRGSEGPEHLRIFFWNNLIGRFASVEAPPDLQYAAAHRNTPGKYLIELPLYLFPWTLLVIAAARRAWRQRRASLHDSRAVRFALAASLPPLLLLSVAATARNIYLAPALPGFALLLAWWAREIQPGPDGWDVRSLRATAAMLLLGVAVFAAVLIVLAGDSSSSLRSPTLYIAISLIGLSAAAILAIRAWAAARDQPVHAQWALFLAYCALLIGPASQVYGQVDRWQDLAKISRAVARDTAGKPLVLLAPDETTRAIIDMYARTSVDRVAGPFEAAGIERIRSLAAAAPDSLFLVQLPNQSPRLPWRARAPEVGVPPAWKAAGLRMTGSYSLPNGRRYALLQVTP